MSKVEVLISRHGTQQELVKVKCIEQGWLGQTFDFDLYLDPDFSSIVLVEPGKITFTGYGDIRAIYIIFSIPNLGIRKEIGSKDFNEIQAKLDTSLFSWKKKIAADRKNQEKETKKKIATEKTENSAKSRFEIGHLLSSHIRDFQFKNFESLERFQDTIHQPFSESVPTRKEYPKKPSINEPIWVKPEISLAQKIGGQAQNIINDSKRRYEKLLKDTRARQEDALRVYENEVKTIDRIHRIEVEAYKSRKLRYEKEILEKVKLRKSSQAEWREKKSLWMENDSKTIIHVVTVLLSHLSETKFFSNNFKIEHNGDTETLIIEYELPNPSDIPDLKSCRYIISEDRFQETKINKTELRKLYEGTCYQLALAVAWSVFEFDTSETLKAIAFNGVVNYKNTATGASTNTIIMSSIFDRNTFSSLNLMHVDAKECFKMFKGIAAPDLVGLTPIAPIVQMKKDDRRFVASRDNISSSIQGRNIAAMHWEDFEHLIREVFEKEFSTRGAEVKITKASSDGGVDVVIFDPNPILGGKIVVQAKRYTNTVNLSSVRDLFGTVLNEGASKGILVTTSDFGPDAYKFAADKPITLLNGSNLLHMLEQHGIKAHINISEARKTLGLQ